MRIAGSFLPAPKLNIPWQLHCKMRKYSDLDPSLVEKGRILKRTIFEEKGMGSISFLWLSPGAKIPPHQHPNDVEYYLGWDPKKKTPKCKGCKKMGIHELENTSSQRWLLIISIKFDLPVADDNG